MGRLESKVVLISGGASGIGAETARLVVREGGKAVLADRDEARGRALAGEIGKDACFVALDVTQEASWQAAVKVAVDTFGGLQGLLNAAGVGVRYDDRASRKVDPGGHGRGRKKGVEQTRGHHLFDEQFPGRNMSCVVRRNSRADDQLSVLVIGYFWILDEKLLKDLLSTLLPFRVGTL